MKPRILLIEEAGDESLRSLLAERGYEVCPAYTGSTAFRELSERNPDVVVTDEKLSDIDGLTLLRRIRASAGALPVILLASSAERATEAMLGGAADYFIRPVPRDSLLRAIERASRGEAGDSPIPSEPHSLGAARSSGPGPWSARYVQGLRLWTGLTQDRFAKIIGYQSRSVSKWETGGRIATHAMRTLRLLESLRDRLVEQFGFRGSQEWLRRPQPVLGGSTAIDRLEAGEFHRVLLATPERPRPPQGAGSEAALEAARDPNYAAFLEDAPKLEAEFPGYVVAYADGARVAVGRDARQLLENLPSEYRHRTLFIKDVPDRVIRFRRPFRVLQA